MCLMMLLGLLVVALVSMFLTSAGFLLPWTSTSAILAGWAVYQLGKGSVRTEKERVTVAVIATFALTFALGYLGYWLIPPVAPPPKEGLAFLVAPPNPDADDLRVWFPIHLGIWAALIASVVWNCYRQKAEIAARENEAGRGVWIEDGGGDEISQQGGDGG